MLSELGAGIFPSQAILPPSACTYSRGFSWRFIAVRVLIRRQPSILINETELENQRALFFFMSIIAQWGYNQYVIFLESFITNSDPFMWFYLCCTFHKGN